MATPATDPQPSGQPAATTGTQQPPATPPADSAKPTSNGDSDTGAGKTFTQADVDRLINERIQRERKTFEDRQAEQNKQLAKVLGYGDDTDDVDPAKALEAEQSRATAAEQRADLAEAKVLAAAAGIKPERVGAFVKLCDISGALKGVDRADEKAVEAAIEGAVKKGVEEYPEFKGSSLPASSGGDRSGGQQQSVTVEQFKKMDVDERTKLYKDNPGLYQQLKAAAAK
ncbi:hypothetical protein BAY59_31290 [Prauserella coralliicola]|nr:hypothetical protein BAY59_31290 [Prauserella coralliicola]